MKFQEALETGLPIRRVGWGHWYDTADEHPIMCAEGGTELFAIKHNLLATDWEVQYPTPKIELTGEEFYEACIAVLKEDTIQRHAPLQSPCVDIKRLADKLFGAK